MQAIIDSITKAFKAGGWPMWPILALLIISLAIIVERIIYLQRCNINKKQLLARLKAQLLSGNVQSAIQICHANPSPLSRIIAAGLSKFHRPNEEVQAAMDEEALNQLPKMEARTGYLATLANVATLVGLLGTILGLIHSFAAVGGAEQSKRASILAEAISEAMNCTAFGLICAVPALLAFAMLNGWTQKLIDDINAGSVEAVNLVISHKTAMK